MPTYFTPLRRKIGVVTLMVACVMTMAWLRSFHRVDVFEINCNSVITGFGSIDQNFVAAWLPNPDNSFSWALPEILTNDFATLTDETNQIDWSWRVFFIRFGIPKEESSLHSFPTHVAVPFVWIVIPLTSFSAWLLLSKPPATDDS